MDGDIADLLIKEFPENTILLKALLAAQLIFPKNTVCRKKTVDIG